MIRLLCLLFTLTCVLPGPCRADESLEGATKVITNRAEYDAFVAARNSKDPLDRAARMEQFLRSFPMTLARVNALEHILLAYQDAGRLEQAEAAAQDILAQEPGNLPVLATLTRIQRIRGTRGDMEAARLCQANGKKGLKALEASSPVNGKPVDPPELRSRLLATFAGGAAFGALKSGDHASARKYYLMAVQAAPDSLADHYQLAEASLALPVPEPSGFWYLARAHHLAQQQQNTAVRDNIARNGKSRYRKFHGSDEGWEELLAKAAGQAQPPAGFMVAAAPSPCERAIALIRTTDLVMLSFSDWKLVLSQHDCSPEAAQAADKLWQYIQERQNKGMTRMVIPAKVIRLNGETLQAAVTQPGRHNNECELTVTLAAPPKKLPEVFADIDIVGTISAYTPQPFQLIINQAELR